MSNDKRPFDRKNQKEVKKTQLSRILLLFTYFSIETQVCTFICVVNTHTVAYASQIENIKWIYDKYCKSWATFGTGILRNMAICAEDDDINDIRRRLSRYGNIIKKFERELRSSWTNSFSSGGRVFVDDQSGIYIKIHTHEYPTTLILDKIDKKKLLGFRIFITLWLCPTPSPTFPHYVLFNAVSLFKTTNGLIVFGLLWTRGERERLFGKLKITFPF